MADLIKYAVGIDVSKNKFDACFGEIDIRQQFNAKSKRAFDNNAEGFKELEQWIKKHQQQQLFLIVAMEATGVYYEPLAYHLHKHEFAVAIMLPNKARKYLQSLGLKSKNDKIDATGLSRMAAEQNLELWQPRGDFFYKLRMLTRHYEQLQASKTIFNNQLHSQEYAAMQQKSVLKHLNQAMNLMDKQLQQTTDAIMQHIDLNAEVKRKVENILSVKGLGLISIATVIAETNGFALFKSIPQLMSYAGYDVIENQSGAHVGKTRISKKGNSHIRRILHMPALTAVTWNQKPFVDLFNRIYSRTTIKMKAYVAVQKKLLTMIYTLWKKDEPFHAEYKNTSGNDEHSVLFPLTEKEDLKSSYEQKIIVPQLSGTTQDELRYNESHEVLFP